MNDVPGDPSSDGATCWTLIQAAAAGSKTASDQFARQYEPVMRKYLAARWNGGRWQKQIDDAVQDIFVECIRPGGMLGKVDSGKPGGFRAFLYGVVRNVIRRFESREDTPVLQHELFSDESSLGKIFDREFARAVMKEASALQAHLAESNGPTAVRRVDLLRARFHDGLPIRVIAEQWSVDPAWLHREYATAREEFHQALRNVVKSHYPNATDKEITEHCSELNGCLK